MPLRIHTAGVLYKAAAVFFAFFLLIQPTAAYEGAANGLLLWYKKVLPVQFPFFVAVRLLRYSGCMDRLAVWMDPVMERLFHLPGEAAEAIAAGWISGYPAGGQMALALFQEKKINEKEYLHLLSFCNVPGPLFVVATVGGQLLHNLETGYRLLAAQLISSIVCAILFRPGVIFDHQSRNRSKRSLPPIGTLLKDAVEESIHTVVMIGGFIVLFSVLLAWLPQHPATAVLEMTNGCAMLAAMKVGWSTAAIGFLLGWGGICVLLQIASAVKEGPELKTGYWMRRLLQGIVAGIISGFLTGFMNV